MTDVVVSPIQNYLEALDTCADRLSSLPTELEGDFLELGEQLQTLHHGAVALSGAATALSRLLSGSALQEQISGLRFILDETQTLQPTVRQGIDELDAILPELVQVQTHLTGLTRVTRNLNALCSMVRMETVRLEQSQERFTALVEDIRTLVRGIDTDVATLVDQLEGALRSVQHTFHRLAANEARQSTEIRLILGDTRHRLEDLAQRQALAAEALQHAATDWDGMSDSFAGMVVALQFHDITRQRLEHVSEVLHEVVAQQPTPPMLHQVCALQKAQLEHAGQEAVEAGQRVADKLQSVARSVENLGRSTAAATQGPSQDDFTTDLQAGLRHLQDAVANYDTIGDQRSQSLLTVSGTVQQMAASIRSITHIGDTMRSIGLNACVHAAQVGDEGRALSVLADAIRSLSTTILDHVGDVSTHLNRVVALADEIARLASEQSATREGHTRRLSACLARMAELLTGTHEEAALLLDRIQTESRGLFTTLRAACNIKVHQRWDRSVRQETQRLGRVLALLSHGLSAADLEGEAEWLNRQLSRYSMASERLVHHARLGDESVTPDQPTPTSSDLGDNVELF